MSSHIVHDPSIAEDGAQRSGLERNHEVITLGVAWLQRLLEVYVLRLRAAAPPSSLLQVPTNVIDDMKADWLLRGGMARRVPVTQDDNAVRARDRYDAARAALKEEGEPAAIDHVSALFGLAPFDEDVLLAAMAPRIDAAFKALCGYAHDRFDLTCATPHLVMDFFATEPDARARAWERLSPATPLRRFSLLNMGEGGLDVLARLEVDERVAGYLLGRTVPDSRVHAYLRPVAAGFCPRRHHPAVSAFVASLVDVSPTPVQIIGRRRSGRRAAAAALAARFGLGLAELDPRAVPADAQERRAAFSLLVREAHLSGFAVLIDARPPAETGDEGVLRTARDVADAAISGLNAMVIVLTEDGAALRTPIATLRLPALEPADRAELWHGALPSAAPDAIDVVSEQFALGPAEIAAVAAMTSATDAAGLSAACRDVAGRGIGGLVRRIEPHFTWDDIVLPPAVRDDLQAVVAQVRHRAQVYRSWGFGRRLPRGRGVTALFSGPSGVGKTMAAEVVARELALDLCHVDLSGVVSKYIGETEKNLRHVFDAAESAGAVLFFDEADALFGKRSEVRDSHDRYANIEVSYLLQRMEAYSGLAILATNMKSHLDSAFMRRLRYLIDLPFPDFALRRMIWQRSFPREAPAEDLDFDALAGLEIAGGNITVIAVNAAFLAAAEGAGIRMEHVARAARAEFRKLDKEFRPTWPTGV